MAQEYRCLYCSRQFGSVVWRGRQRSTLRINWDHMVPYSYSRNNTTGNFAAACQICNGIKGAIMFESIEKARVHINGRWKEKGITDSMPEMRLRVPTETPVAKVL